MLIQSGPEDEEADALLAIASQAGVPKHMKLGLVQMKDQERMDRCPALPDIALPFLLYFCISATNCQQFECGEVLISSR